MRIKIVAVDESTPTGPWKIVYTRDGSQTHNHPPSLDVRIHAAHRQHAQNSRASVQPKVDLIEVQTAAGVLTQQVLATMMLTDLTSLVLPTDISNAMSATRLKQLATGTSIEVLLKKLKEHNFYHAFEIDPTTNRLLYLMWAHPDTTALARHFVDLLLLDCTYKTNRHRLPLLNAVILTGMSTLLPLAQIWLPGEADPDFTWALSKLRELPEINSIPLSRVTITDRDLACVSATEMIFPLSAKLLCRWHIRRNVLAQAQKRIGQTVVQTSELGRKKTKSSIHTDMFMAKFDETINSETEIEFTEHSAQLDQMSSSMGEYLNRVWWPYKIKFVRCWTNEFTNFGCHDTSGVEGTHAKMKSWLDNSNGDLLTVFNKLLPWWILNGSRNKLSLARDLREIPMTFRDRGTYSAVARIISVWALTKTHELWVKAYKIVVHQVERSVCDGVFRRVHGRPCLHDLMLIIGSHGQLKLLPDQFDKHRWLPSPSIEHSTRILEPIRRPSRRRTQSQPRLHQADYCAYSTRRDFSGFDLSTSSIDACESTTGGMYFQELLQSDEIEWQELDTASRT